MSYSFPLSVPTLSVGPKRITMRAATTVAVVRNPWTLETQTFEFVGESWIIDVTYPPLVRADAELLQAFLLKLWGPSGTFLCGDSAAATPRGSALGTPLVNGGSQTGKSLVTKGWNASQTNVLRAGDYIQIGNNLYKNLTDVNSDGSGNATLDIFPNLRLSYADSTAIITTSAKGKFRLTDNTVPIYNVGDAKIYDVGFTGAEVVGA